MDSGEVPPSDHRGQDLQRGGLDSTRSTQTWKLFIGHLDPSTTSGSLRKVFDTFGTVLDAEVHKDRHGHSRGFGFVVYKDFESYEQVLKCVLVKVDGRVVDIKPALPRTDLSLRSASETPHPHSQPQRNEQNTKKLFVGGLPQDITRARFEDYFSSFGPIFDAVVMTNKDTGRPRGFGFVTYQLKESVDRVMQEGTRHFIQGKMVDVKIAIPRNQMTSAPGSGRREEPRTVPPRRVGESHHNHDYTITPTIRTPGGALFIDGVEVSYSEAFENGFFRRDLSVSKNPRRGKWQHSSGRRQGKDYRSRDRYTTNFSRVPPFRPEDYPTAQEQHTQYRRSSGDQLPRQLHGPSYHPSSRSFENHDIWSSGPYDQQRNEGSSPQEVSSTSSSRSSYTPMYSPAPRSTFQTGIEHPGQQQEEKSYAGFPSYPHGSGGGERNPQNPYSQSQQQQSSIKGSADELSKYFKSSLSLASLSPSTSCPSSKRSSHSSGTTIVSPRSSGGSILSSVSSLNSPLHLYSGFESRAASRNSGTFSARSSGTLLKSGEESPSSSVSSLPSVYHNRMSSQAEEGRPYVGEPDVSSSYANMPFEGDEFSHAGASDSLNRSFYSAPVSGTLHSSPVTSSLFNPPPASGKTDNQKD